MVPKDIYFDPITRKRNYDAENASQNCHLHNIESRLYISKRILEEMQKKTVLFE